MFIHDPPKPQTRKELKVNLPTHQHRSLRELTVVTGLETPAIVSQALNLYFTKLAEETAARDGIPLFRSSEDVEQPVTRSRATLRMGGRL